MSDDARRSSGWDRKEELLMSELRNLRLSSDAGLKLSTEPKEDFASFKGTLIAHMDHQKSQVDDLRNRLDDANKWLAGLAATLIAGIIFFLLNQLHCASCL